MLLQPTYSLRPVTKGIFQPFSGRAEQQSLFSDLHELFKKINTFLSFRCFFSTSTFNLSYEFFSLSTLQNRCFMTPSLASLVSVCWMLFNIAFLLASQLSQSLLQLFLILFLIASKICSGCAGRLLFCQIYLTIVVSFSMFQTTSIQQVHFWREVTPITVLFPTNELSPTETDLSLFIIQIVQCYNRKNQLYFLFHIPTTSVFCLSFPPFINTLPLSHLIFIKYKLDFKPMSLSKAQAEQKFNKINIQKRDLPITPRSVQQHLQFMDYKIRKEFKSFTILSLCGGAERGGFIVEKNLQRAFTSMSLNQKIDYYGRYVNNVSKAIEKSEALEASLNNNPKQEKVKVKNPVSMKLKVGKESKAFEQAEVVIENSIVSSKSKGLPDIDLRNYLIRKSKKKNQYCYALEAIRSADVDTVRFAFLSGEDQKKYLPIIENEINEASYLNLQRQICQFSAKRKSFPSELQSKQLKLKNDNLAAGKQTLINLEANNLRNSRKADLNKSVIEDIVKSREDQELDEQLTQFINDQNEQVEKLELEKKKSSEQTPYFRQYRNIFKIMLPSYSLKELSKLHNYGSIYQSKIAQLYVYINAHDHSEFKMQFTIDLPLEVVCKGIYNVQLYKYWHPQIDEGQIKLKISSENSCITYLKAKAFSEWYKERDYLLLTHMFKIQNSYYIVEKSIENSNFIPFQSITRGKFIYVVWRIQPENGAQSSKSKPKCRVIMELKVNHEGLLNKNHQKQLTLRHLKGFENMESYYQKIQNQKKLSDLMGFEWAISDRQSYRNQSQVEVQNANSLRTCDFQDGSEISSNQEDEVFYSIQDLSEEEKQLQAQEQQQKSQHQIEPNQKIQSTQMLHSQLIGKVQEEQIVTDAQGLVILPQKYLKKKQKTAPFEAEKVLMEFNYDNILEKDHWVTEKTGGLKLVNQVKINAQNNVLKFIMKTLKKNLFSGKGILNISLPVQIFNVDSNLQRICVSMCLGPEFLQGVAKSSNHLDRFKKVLAFGLSNSIIYFDVQKPFNPILGETYQGYIRGCPIYAQQISHHPPITSVYFVGRGYKVYGNLQAVVHVHMNSGDGINEGLYHVVFDDGQEIVFQTPPAEISGLAVGDRRFNYKEKGTYFDLTNLYYCEMKMQASGGLWGKKSQFSDQIWGQIVKVKPDFMRKFLDAKIDKKPSPAQSDIAEKLGQLSGRWSYDFKIDGVTYYDIRKNIPDRMIDQIYPLNSNSNYREDLLYRKKNDLSRSQIEKQRLEIIQRGDRKLREKFHGPAH